MNTPHDSPLGRSTPYRQGHDPGLLFPIPRAQGRTALGLGAELPFHGIDLWNGYELSWLDAAGKPQIALIRIDVPADSPNLIESKSLKLYLGAFAGTRTDAPRLQADITHDLSACTGASVQVHLIEPAQFADQCIQHLAGHCIDNTPVQIEHYGPPRPDFLHSTPDDPAEESLVSHLLKSNCPVTGQPDWASVQISYRGPRIERAGLLRYLISFREHNEFHEHCVERIFCDLMHHCAVQELSVYARYTRRGGLDINPWRSTRPGPVPNPRLARQ